MLELNYYCIIFFSNLTGTTDCVEHHIELTQDKPYPLVLLSDDFAANDVHNTCIMWKINIIL